MGQWNELDEDFLQLWRIKTGPRDIYWHFSDCYMYLDIISYNGRFNLRSKIRQDNVYMYWTSNLQ